MSGPSVRIGCAFLVSTWIGSAIVPMAAGSFSRPALQEGFPLPPVDPTGSREEPSAGAFTLEDLFRIAAGQSERVGRAREELSRAVSQRRSARALVFPQITGEASYFRQNAVDLPGASDGDGTGGGGQTVVTTAEARSEALVRLRQPLFSGFRDLHAIAAAQRTIEALEFGVEDAGRVIKGEIAEAFYQVFQREGEVGTLRDTLAVERERLREIEARRDVGLARKTEVLLVRATLAEDESRLTRALNDMEIARDRLGFLVGVPIDRPLRDTIAIGDLPAEEARPSSAGPGPDEPTPVPPDPSAMEPLIGKALATRSDLKQREREVEAALRQVRLARGEYWPRADVEATYILDRNHYSSFQEETDWTAELNLVVPIFDGGRIRANVAAAESRVREARLNYDEQTRRVRLEVESAWRSYQSDLAQLATLQARVAAADENDRLVREEYRSGLATSLEAITAQNQLLAGRLDLERQRYQVKLDWIVLAVAQGASTGDTPPGGPPDPPVAPEDRDGGSPGIPSGRGDRLR